MRTDLEGQSPFGDLVGRTIVKADAAAKTVEAAYEAKPEFTNRIGTVAGGMLSAMLDSVTGLAALVALPETLGAVHTSLSVEYLQPARAGRLLGRARVVAQLERDIRCEGELVDAEGTIVARANASLRTVRKRKPQ